MFEVPQDLSSFSVDALRGMVELAQQEFSALKDSVSPETVTDEQLARLTELQKFIRVSAPDEFSARQSRADTFAALDAAPASAGPSITTATATIDSADVVHVTISDIIDHRGAPVVETPPSTQTFSTLVASAGVPGYESGQRLPTMLDVARAFEARSAGHSAMGRTSQGPVSYPVAQLVRDYPDEFSMAGDSTDYAKLMHVIDERRLPGGSLLASDRIARTAMYEHPIPGRDVMVAAAGWCAPSETDYGICLQISTDGLINVPEVQARRGGVRHNTGIEFDTIFGTCSPGPVATGYFNLTEAQVAAGTQKTCLEIPCPAFEDTRLGVTGLCLTGNILSIRGYPEFTEAFTRGAMAASAHQVNALQIAAMVAGSTAVTLTGSQPWLSDATVISQVLSAVEMAIVDMKYRLRAQQGATMEVVLPYWLLAQMRADWIRRNHAATEELALTDATIRAAFAARGARVQFVYDWQDAFATCAVSGSPGADTPITQLPTSLNFLVYPAGTWVKAVQNVITLNSIYDSTKIATNQVTHLFTEDGWAMLKMCPVSRVYSINICPSGAAGANHTIVCA